MLAAVNIIQIYIYVALGAAVLFVGLYFVVKAAVCHGILQAAEELARREREAARKKKRRAVKETLSDHTWSCPKCTYENPMDEFVCRRCGYEKK